jgi:hypothetical protein
MKKHLFGSIFLFLFYFHVPLTAQEYGSWNQPIPNLETWWRPVEHFEPVASGEHPRLLFRQKDLPALREKMQTPEGQAILKRLRYLLNGSDGEGMPIAFNPAKEAYADGGKKNSVRDTAGVYTFGHVAGYGLLYQLTGEQRYAEWGRQCFELALQGQRDRDDRYSWVDPGGALRAGPVLGWMAVGYDLCYNGWDPAAREKLGKAIENYHTDIFLKYGQVYVNLENMAGGTMPPKSNHYGMQVGGTALALLAITKEPWADQPRLDSLLEISARSMVHNVAQGFGDGGYFAEGDGTGSMASQIAYLPALQAWKNTMGMDFGNTDRPNVRMTALKWLYLTVVQDGRPEIWPVRGGYPHNAWSRRGLSGAGYFSLAFGVLPDRYAAAMKWFYDHFLLESDTEAGAPYEVSAYPHLAVCAFVNWPTELPAQNPETVLPHCYRDSQHGFYAWRSRWRDENDIVITALTQPVRGYMGEEADSAFHLLAYGRKMTWGAVPGPVEQWETSPDGATSVLTFENGLSVAVDLSGTSGADAVLVATGAFEGTQVKIGRQIVTVKSFPEKEPPSIRVRGKRLLIGKQRLRLTGGRWGFR